nr:reverse transcriptase domain-containing protein [Tanacetum cinerariifolium]
MIPSATPLVRFSREIIWPLGQVSLLVKIGDEEHSSSAWMNFMVVRSPSPYNRIIGRPRVKRIQAVPSTAHEMLKFPIAGRTVTLRSSRIIPLESTMLNVREGCLPARQKKKGQTPEKNKAIYEKVEKLVDVDIMKEVHYHSWLSDPVMVKKHDDIWRMCVDFKDLNKASPKDGYHQIKMAKEDEEKTAFITSQGIFCYSKMSFGLKNAGATYQRLVDKAFQKQIGWNLEVYVDDLVIKSCTEKEVMRDIEETFKTLREINMKLNPKKCTFGMREDTFLGYEVNADGLEVCPDKVEAVLSLPSSKCLKDVQKLNGNVSQNQLAISNGSHGYKFTPKVSPEPTYKGSLALLTRSYLILYRDQAHVWKRHILTDGATYRPDVYRKSIVARGLQAEGVLNSKINEERDLKKRLGPRHARSMSESPEPRHGHSESPRKRDLKRKTVFKMLVKIVFHRLGDKGKSMSAYQTIQGVDHTTVAVEILKAATGALAKEE